MPKVNPCRSALIALGLLPGRIPFLVSPEIAFSQSMATCIRTLHPRRELPSLRVTVADLIYNNLKGQP